MHITQLLTPVNKQVGMITGWEQYGDTAVADNECTIHLDGQWIDVINLSEFWNANPENPDLQLFHMVNDRDYYLLMFDASAENWTLIATMDRRAKL